MYIQKTSRFLCLGHISENIAQSGRSKMERKAENRAERKVKCIKQKFSLNSVISASPRKLIDRA
jgi:hypothetical protein